MKGNLLGLLGICRKAGKLKLGFDPVAISLGKGAELLLFTQDISPKTKARMLKKAEAYQVRILSLEETSDIVEKAIGKRVAVMAITDRGLADKATLLFNEAHDACRPQVSGETV